MSSASRLGPSLGARVDVVWKGYGTFRGTVVEGEDASKCWVLYNNDGFSGGAATRLSMMLKRTVVRRTRALARAACKTCTAK